MLRRIAPALVAISALMLAGTSAFAQTSSSSYGTPVPVSDSQTVIAGAEMVVAFANAPPNTEFHAEAHSDPVDLGTHTSDANGRLVIRFSTAGLEAGAHTLVATGGGVTLSSTFTVVEPEAEPVNAAALPRTGSSSTIPLTNVALVLLAVGGLVVLSVRRSRTRANA